MGRMVLMHSNKREEIKEAQAGDIIAIVGLKDTTTGDTLCAIDAPVVLEKMDFPEPVIKEGSRGIGGTVSRTMMGLDWVMFRTCTYICYLSI